MGWLWSGLSLGTWCLPPGKFQTVNFITCLLDEWMNKWSRSVTHGFLLPTVGPQTSCFTSLGLCFLIYKISRVTRAPVLCLQIGLFSDLEKGFLVFRFQGLQSLAYWGQGIMASPAYWVVRSEPHWNPLWFHIPLQPFPDRLWVSLRTEYSLAAVPIFLTAVPT